MNSDMKPKVGIGITTYQDIRSKDFALALYQALVACSPKLTPSKVEVLYDTYAIDNAEDFAAHWCTEIRHIVRPKYGDSPSYTPTSEFGANWRIKGALSGDGSVFFGGRDPNSPSTVTLRSNWASRPSWEGLFYRLVELFKPSHANLHVFTERELELAGHGHFAFRAPIVGERAFTSWMSNLGQVRGPDPWQLAERRRYRFLPDLAWGNFLGPEFLGRFDPALLLESAKNTTAVHNGILFQVTEKLGDLVDQPAIFEKERTNLRKAFAADFFRIE
jgi:hypothetical protein